MSTARSENVATPFEAFTGVVPNSVPPPGFAPREIPIGALEMVTTWFAASSIAAWTPSPGSRGCPAKASAGCRVKATWSGHPTPTPVEIVFEGAKSFPVPL